MTGWILANTNRNSVAPRGDSLKLEPLPDFDAAGRFGKTPWYGRAFPQLASMILFPIIFFGGFLVSVSGFLKNKQLPAFFTGLVCLLNFLLLLGFSAFLATSIFPQGVSLMRSFSIPFWQKSLPLFGAISLLLAVILPFVFYKKRQDLKKWQMFIAFTAIVFPLWLYYWNLIGISY